MRSEKEMFDLILNYARGDERVRAVILDGSRADPEAPRDMLQDYDIIYVVTDVYSFKADPHWIDIFGERMILQLPDDMGDPPPAPRPGYCYLMQFMDGTRIDLNLYPLDKLDEVVVDSICRPLLDKDGLLPPEIFDNQGVYLPTPPDAKQFADCCNEFWWCSPYVAKGLWRSEILYARHMLDNVVREELMKMLVWYLAMHTGFGQNTGKYGKFFKKFLEVELWELLLQTYSDADYENSWNALFKACDLFRIVAPQVAEHFGFEYPRQEDERIYAWLQFLKSNPKAENVE